MKSFIQRGDQSYWIQIFLDYRNRAYLITYYKTFKIYLFFSLAMDSLCCQYAPICCLDFGRTSANLRALHPPSRQIWLSFLGLESQAQYCPPSLTKDNGCCLTYLSFKLRLLECRPLTNTLTINQGRLKIPPPQFQEFTNEFQMF